MHASYSWNSLLWTEWKEMRIERRRANCAVCEPQWCGSKCVFSFCLSLANTQNAPAVKADAETYLPTLYCPSGQQAHSVRCLLLRVVRGSDFNHMRQVRMLSVQAHRVRLTPSHRHTHISHTNIINSDVFQIQYVWWFMGSCVSLTASSMSLPPPPSVFPSIYAYLCPFSSSSSPSIPLPSLPYFPHHHLHGETSASWQRI